MNNFSLGLAFALNVSSAVPTSLQPIEKGNTQLGVNTSTAGSGAQYTVHTVKGGGTGMVLTFAAVNYNGPVKGEVVLGNNLTVRAAIEYPLGSGNFTNVLFGGAVSGTVTDGSYLDSDPYSRTWSDGDQFGVWVYAAGTNIPIRNTAAASNVELYTDEGCITGASVSTTPTNSIADNGNRSTRLCALVGIFAQRPTTDTTIAILGDSLQSGTNSSAPANYATSDRVHGDMPRVFSQYYACLNLGIGADCMVNAMYSQRTVWTVLYKRATAIISVYGTNDFGIRLFSSAEFLAHRQRFLPWFKGKKFIEATITPRATGSSDSYVTEASQTIPGYAANINTFNTTLRGLSTFLERRTPLQGSSITNAWIVNGSTTFYATTDGTHMSLTAQSLLIAQSTSLKAAFDAATVSTATQPAANLSGGTFNGTAQTNGTATIAGLACVAYGATMEFFATVGTSVITNAFVLVSGAAGLIKVNASGQLVFQQNSGATSFTGTTNIADGVERHISVVEKADATGASVYINGVLEISASYTASSTNTTTATSFQVTSGTGNAVRQISLWKGELRTGAFTPPSPGWIATPSALSNLIVYFPLASNGNGQLGGYLPQ